MNHKRVRHLQKEALTFSNSPVVVPLHENAGVVRSELKELALWFLRLPAAVVFHAKRYLGITFWTTRIQIVRQFSLNAAFRSLGRAAYCKQAAADTFAAQYPEIKEVEAKRDELRRPVMVDHSTSTSAKIGRNFKNLLRRLQSPPVARRLNCLWVSLGKHIATDEAVGTQFFNEWSNLTAVRTKMVALKKRAKTVAEYVPSQTDFSWWPRTIPGCLVVIALLAAALSLPQHQLYGVALLYFLVSGTRYLWFYATVASDQRPKLRWWQTPGAVAAFVCVILAVNAPHDDGEEHTAKSSPIEPTAKRQDSIGAPNSLLKYLQIAGRGRSRGSIQDMFG